MIYPSYDKLDEWCKYSLVTLAAKRAKQIKGGAPPLIVTLSKNPLTIALEEIAQGKVTCVVADNDDIHLPPTDIDSLELFTVPADIVLGTDESLLDDIDIDEEEEEDEITLPTLAVTDDEENWEEAEVEEEEEPEDPAIIDDVDEDEPLDLDAQTGLVASELKIDDDEDVKPKAKRKKGEVEVEIEPIAVEADVIDIVDEELLDLDVPADREIAELSAEEEVIPKKRGRKSKTEEEPIAVEAAVVEEVKPKTRRKKSDVEVEPMAADSAVEDVKPKAKRKKSDVEDKPIVAE